MLAMRGLEILTAYEPTTGNPALMAVIEKTFVPAITSRTWDTVEKCAVA